MGFLEAMIPEADLERAKKTECEVQTILDEDKRNCILKYFVLLSSSFSFILDIYFTIYPDLFFSFNSSWPHFVSFNRVLTNVNNLSLVTLKGKPFNIAIIDQKTSTKKQTILENSKYYIKSQEVANVKVGREQDNEMVHKHGHGSCNEWRKNGFLGAQWMDK